MFHTDIITHHKLRILLLTAIPAPAISYKVYSLDLEKLVMDSSEATKLKSYKATKLLIY